MSESECRQLMAKWLLTWYPRMPGYKRRLINRALEMAHCQGGGEPNSDECQQQAADFDSYYRRSYETVRDWVNRDVPPEAARSVKNGLLVWLWDQRRTGDLSRFEEKVRTELSQAAKQVKELSSTIDLPNPPFEEFKDWLEAYLWEMLFKGGRRCAVEKLVNAQLEQAELAKAWQKDVGASVASSLRDPFDGAPPIALENNIRRFLWKHPREKPGELILDAIRIAKALADEPYETAVTHVFEIVRKRTAPPILHLIRELPEIELDEVVNEAWKRAQEQYKFDQSRAAEIPGLVYVIARRVVLEMMKIPPSPPSDARSGHSEPQESGASQSFLRSIPYIVPAPHQSIVWTWIEVLEMPPRRMAERSWNWQLNEGFGALIGSLGALTDFLDPLRDKLRVRLSQLKLEPATKQAYQHLLERNPICGETRFRHYDTEDLPAKPDDRWSALESRLKNDCISALQRQATKWCQSVNRAWKTATIRVMFRMELGLE